MAGTAKLAGDDSVHHVAAPAKSSRERVRAFLEEHGLIDGLVECEVMTKTAAQAADAAGCELGQIVKSLLVTVGGVPVLALVAGDKRANFAAIADQVAPLGVTGGVAMAPADLVREITGYAIGGVCPFDLPQNLIVLIDSSFERFDQVTPAAGTPQSFCTIKRERFAEVVHGIWAPIGE